MQTQLEATLGVKEAHLDAMSFSAEPKGIAASMLDAGQTSILRELIDCYLARLPDELADQQARLVEQEFDRLTFLWAGGAERGQPHYYRIQGERVFIEYDNSQRGANRIHTVWRDLANDFGGDARAPLCPVAPLTGIADRILRHPRANRPRQARVCGCRSGLRGELSAEVGVEVAAGRVGAT